jgi:hypothetical protein
MKIMELKEIYWDRSVREAVWKKGHIKPDYSPHVLRWDDQGRIMMWSKFGRTDSIFGWTIEAHDPLKNGESPDLDNLYPVSTFSPKEKE